ncbi:Imm50 family immunity protein [Streptomyces sp. H27-H1]|uniref:Imm50 family immunity protein n=1 Tax=Streptomyces sp. H27-H1 TaxID=2996461 RepID=UPI00226F233D|nr:Imm50 family immunity protein [Streptomyces sp. H27-H1]MCY0928732.1 Imm50 family immunity protein [Streptomyces sp. H27-H1]
MSLSLPPWPPLAALYDTPPELSGCPLYYVQVDERDTSVTLGFETGRLPDHPQPDWKEGTYNTLRFFVVFSGVDELRMTGIAAEHPEGHDRTATVSETPAGRQRLSVTSPTRSISFTAKTSRITHVRVYLQGSL